MSTIRDAFISFFVAVSCPETLPSKINFHSLLINICNVKTRINNNNKEVTRHILSY